MSEEGAMSEEATKRLVLELHSQSEPIQGRMREESGTSHDFVGWLGLAAALRNVLADGTAGAPDTRPASGG
jgi:hypothetical protein